IMNHLEALVRERGKSLILITHDLALASNRADRIVIMRDGGIVETGMGSEILQSSQDPYTQLLASKTPQFVFDRLDERNDERAVEEQAQVVLRVSDLAKHYRDRHDRRRTIEAVKGVGFEIREGRSFALIGESGSGKTTTARCCLRLEEATSGTVEFLGEDITHVRGRRLREARKNFSVVYQSPYSSLDPLMSIESIISEPLTVHGIGTRLERHKRTTELLDAVGLPQSYLK